MRKKNGIPNGIIKYLNIIIIIIIFIFFTFNNKQNTWSGCEMQDDCLLCKRA